MLRYHHLERSAGKTTKPSLTDFNHSWSSGQELKEQYHTGRQKVMILRALLIVNDPIVRQFTHWYDRAEDGTLRSDDGESDGPEPTYVPNSEEEEEEWKRDTCGRYVPEFIRGQHVETARYVSSPVLRAPSALIPKFRSVMLGILLEESSASGLLLQRFLYVSLGELRPEKRRFLARRYLLFPAVLARIAPLPPPTLPYLRCSFPLPVLLHQLTTYPTE